MTALEKFVAGLRRRERQIVKIISAKHNYGERFRLHPLLRPSPRYPTDVCLMWGPFSGHVVRSTQPTLCRALVGKHIRGHYNVYYRETAARDSKGRPIFTFHRLEKPEELS